MKLYIVIAVFIFFGSIGKTQVVFCPPGAQWNYLFTQSWLTPWATVNESIKYYGYTLENGDTIKTLNHTKFFSEGNTGFIFYTAIKQKGDTIYMRNTFTNNQWQVLYNFAAQVGQSWSNSFTNSESYTTTVVSTGTAMVANLVVKQLTVNYAAKSGLQTYTYGGLISERFGSNRFLFNYSSRLLTDGDMALEFLCYKDNTIGVKQFSAKGCDYYNMVGLNELNPNNYQGDYKLKIYPNPSSDFLMLEQPEKSEESDICLKDVLGKELKRIRIKDKTIFDIQDLNQGIYFIEVKQDGKLVTTIKIIKE